MKKDHLKGTIIMTILIVILLILVGGSMKNAYVYYSSADYIVDTYVKCLNERNYNKLYQLLDPQSIQGLESKAEVVDYYKRIYEKENRLVSVQKVAKQENTYWLVYQYTKENTKADIELTQTKGRWRIIFPFKTNEIQVFAPYGANVYLNQEKLTYSSNKCYELDNVLPGKYMLRVEVAQEGYKDYYSVVHMPEDQKYIVPYEMAHLTVQVAPGFKVQCNEFTKMSQKDTVSFEDLLLGEYQISVQDEAGIFKEQTLTFLVERGENIANLRAFQLSDKGESQLKVFLEDFYESYIKAIESHDATLIDSYFIRSQVQAQKELFSSWYIDQKDIKQVDMQFKINDVTVDEKGYIHVIHTEEAELWNREYDEWDNEKSSHYKVILTWETMINPLTKTWTIMEQSIKQSMVAIEDQEGRWVQY